MWTLTLSALLSFLHSARNFNNFVDFSNFKLTLFMHSISSLFYTSYIQLSLFWPSVFYAFEPQNNHSDLFFLRKTSILLAYKYFTYIERPCCWHVLIFFSTLGHSSLGAFCEKIPYAPVPSLQWRLSLIAEIFISRTFSLR